MLFNKKIKSKDKEMDDKVASGIKVMPEVFYGGKNPTIYESKDDYSSMSDTKLKMPPPVVGQVGKQTTPSTSVSQKDVRTLSAPAIASMGNGHPVPKKDVTKKDGYRDEKLMSKSNSGHVVSDEEKSSSKKKRLFIVIFVILFLVIVGFFIWYYVNQGLGSRNSNIEAPNTVVPITTPVVTPPVAIENTQAPSIVTSTDQVTSTSDNTEDLGLRDTPLPIEFPGTLLANSFDLDQDSLTDAEESTFGTDPGTWDSDRDGYYDGQEIFNLYSPSGFAPARLIDSGLVTEYRHPVFGYRFYYPNTWLAAPVDISAKQVLVTSPGGDFIEFQAVERFPREDFTDWFGRVAVGQNYSLIEEVENRFSQPYFKRNDGLVSYFVTDNLVFVVVYHPQMGQNISFRHIMQMMVQSFRPDSSVNLQIPEQQVLIQSSTQENIFEDRAMSSSSEGGEGISNSTSIELVG